MTNVQVHVDFVRDKRSGQSLMLGGYMYINYLGNSCQSSVNICKQFGPTSGPTESQSWSVSKPFDTLGRWFKIFIFVSGQAVQAHE